MELWIPITIAAAFFQNIRSVLQKRLKGRLSNTGAAYARFLYALPLACVYLALLTDFDHHSLPSPNLKFFLYCLIGAIFQILFTVSLLWMFSFRSFAVGTTFSKLEVVTVAVLGILLLGDDLDIAACGAILLAAGGVVLLSTNQSGLSLNQLPDDLKSKPTMVGISSAFLLGGSVVFFRGSALALEHEEFLITAAFTLVSSLLIQTVLFGAWIALREPGEWQKLIGAWRPASLVGVAGLISSIGWFTAFTIEKAAYVRALGQIELLFAFFTTLILFKEQVKVREIVGACLIAASVLVIVLIE